MRYVSTRGGPPCGFLQALMRGRAPGGGIYLPQDWPQLTLDDLASAARRPLTDTVEALLLRFGGLELDPELATAAVREALTVFGHPAVAPLREMDPNLWLLDLARGPTMTAADAEMQVLARLAERTASLRGRTATFVLATDGQDGPAAVEAFRGRSNTQLVILFPAVGPTAAQKRVICDPFAANVRAVEIDGDARACRQIAAAVFADDELVAEADLGWLGPDNLGRVVIACAVLFAAACRLGAPDRQIAIGAPAEDSAYTFAALGLAQMGLGLGDLVLAELGDGGLVAALVDGRLQDAAPRKAGGAMAGPGWSAAFERLYFEAAERHVVETGRAARAFSDSGAIDLPPGVRRRMGQMIRATAVDEGEVLGVVMAARNVAGERLDRSSAAILAALRRHAGEGGWPAISPLLADHAWTATGQLAGLDREADLPPPLRRPAAELRFDRLPAEPDALGTYLRRFTGLSRAA